MNDTPKLAYTVAEACHALGIGRTTLYRLFTEKRIDARQLDGRTVVLAENLRAFLDGLPPSNIGQNP